MSVQTDKNPVILIGELALRLIRRSFKTKLGFRPNISKSELDELFKKIEASLMTLKYSYLSLDQILFHPELKTLEENGSILSDAITLGFDQKSTNQLAITTIQWGVKTLSGLSRRLKYSCDQLGAGIDIKVVRIQNLKASNKLMITRAYDDRNKYTIVTNLMDIKPNLKLAVAVLPPAVIANQISTAMYLGLEERQEKVGEYLDPQKVDLKEVNAILYQYLTNK